MIQRVCGEYPSFSIEAGSKWEGTKEWHSKSRIMSLRWSGKKARKNRREKYQSSTVGILFFEPTLPSKNMNLPYSICMYWTNFWQSTVHVVQNIIEKTLIEVGSSHTYASFGTFCVQIGQLFAAQWVFEKCMKTVKSLFSKENDVDFEFFRKFKVSLRLD